MIDCSTSKKANTNFGIQKRGVTVTKSENMEMDLAVGWQEKPRFPGIERP